MRRFLAVAALLLAAACAEEHPSPPPPPVIYEPMVVFFDAESASLSDNARIVIKEEVMRAHQDDCEKLFVAGYTDRVGSERGNVQLSARRAEAVRDELVRDGYRGFAGVEGRGSDVPFVPPSDKPEPLNRRVQIDFDCPQNS